MNMYKGYDLDNLERKCVKEVAELSRQAGAEGIVLLKNENVLPFAAANNVAVFGRTQIDYVKSGLGSGGLVNTEYTVNITDGLRKRIDINEDLSNTYSQWVQENPADMGCGWTNAPWSQPEMPVSDELCIKAAKKSDSALIVIGRIAGEARDNQNVVGSYLLTAEEENMIKTVMRHFERVCVALNTGNIMDMKWVDRYNVPCVLYCWQGGQEGGNALADVLSGDVCPSGKLTDTIAYDIEDYPSTANHGDPVKNIYQEDIYVGYRYFETFAADRVMFPFGFGLSYTEFVRRYRAKINGDDIVVTAEVRNVGNFDGKEVVQVYFSAPQGNLGKPRKQLVRFAKTKLLKKGEQQVITLNFSIDEMASYDDIDTFSNLLEQGEYVIYAGNSVRDENEILRVTLDGKIVEPLRQALAPTESFERIKPRMTEHGVEIGYEAAPLRQYDLTERIGAETADDDKPYSGNAGISLKDVADGRHSLDEFVSQLSEFELACLVRGEGMNSPKVTRGTASAFGGVTDELLSCGIPPVCTTDGPSGIRMDTGEKATLIVNGTCLASTWNNELVGEIYSYLGIELRSNNVDILLGPGINIHRSPLNGRNFEYFSEDPYLAGTMAASCTAGLADAGVAGTLKHFACNSQEYSRRETNSVVSERALREIYLKPFEIAVRSGLASAIMTSYNKINGSHSASNYDLCTSILRGDWGYKGIVMTDWWTSLDGDSKECGTNLKDMVITQNDLYMVCDSSKDYKDNIMKSVGDGVLDVCFLRKCAKNILGFILKSPAMHRKPQECIVPNRDDYAETLRIDNIKSGVEYNLNNVEALELEYITSGSDLEQYVINIFEKEKYLTCSLSKGTGNEMGKTFILLPKHEGKLKIEFSDAFKYVNLIGLNCVSN